MEQQGELEKGICIDARSLIGRIAVAGAERVTGVVGLRKEYVRWARGLI